MSRALIRWTAAALTGALLAACGGSGDDPAKIESAENAAHAAAPSPAEAAAGALVAQAESRKRALAVQTAAAEAIVVYDPLASAEQLFDYGEQALPLHFPGHPATAAASPFMFRYYAASGVYLGVVVDDGAFTKGGVYVMGGAFGNQPLHAGQVTDYISPTAPGFRATPVADKAVVVQGSLTQMRINVERINGYTGAVQLSLAGLPAGVAASTVTVPAGATQAEIAIVAQAGAPHSLPTTVQLSASGFFGTRNASAQRAVTVTVRGAPGVADTSFGGGTQITQVANGEDYAHAVAVQADGKVVTAGTTAIPAGTVVALTRHLRDGGLDASFGNGGKVITQVGARGDSARAVAVQPDGKIVVAGWTDATGIDANFLVLRYLANGTLDPAFADGGRLIFPFGNGTDRAYAVAIQEDGRIVVGGTTLASTSTSGQDFALIRVNTNGTLDQGFGDGGKVVTPMQTHSGGDIVYALALPVIDGEQRILAVGGEGDFMAARYKANGTLDGTFASGGKYVGVFNRNIGAARAVTLLPGGRMVLAGGIYNDFAAAQLTPAGTLDATFGQGGLVTVPVSTTNWDNATAIVRQADGKLLLGGWAYAGNSSSADFVALRLLPGGALDTLFGNQGIAIHPVATNARSDSARGMVLQSDERISTVRAILGGEVSGSNNDFGLLRLWL